VQPAAVQKHGGENVRKMANRVGEELARYERPMAHKSLALTLLDEKHYDIRDDEEVGRYRRAAVLAFVGSDRKNHGDFLQ
jgi:hypothetical protein